MQRLLVRGVFWVFLLVSALGTAGCQKAFFGTMEKFGYHKRDILVSRVEKARDSQEEAKEQFESALDRFRAVLGTRGGPLEEKYNQLNAELQRSEARADEVRERIDSVEDVAGALFEEWEDELEQYSDPDLRRQSERRLDQTRRRYEQLIAAMHRAEDRMEPVLKVFRDQVLFLKHNLNAQAIASIQDELTTVEADVARLIKEMEAAIAEAEDFIQTMGQEE